MTIAELAALIGAENVTPNISMEKDIACGYTCDLLSWVMAHGQAGMAWVTVQNNMNVIAVAVLADMACVISPENIAMDPTALNKANDEGICVLKSPLTAYEICGRMHAAGVPADAEV